MNILLVIITSLLVDTASTEAYLQGQYMQSTMPLVGTSDGGFSIHAQSIYDINTVSRVFGEASYSWSQSKGNQYVENTDYTMLYPYLTCDTVGGGMRTEQYTFRGGYRMKRNHVLWHLALQYRAVQSYRSIDPRPKNKVAELNVEGSVGYVDDQYAYSLMAEVGRYKQNNDISFYSELGNAQVYHLVQLDQDYARFSGDFLSAYYHGLTAGGTFMLQPQSRGWLSGLGYHYMFVTKELSSSASTPIARIRTHTVSALLGYAAPRWRATVQADYMTRIGTQYLYGDVTGNYYHLLLKEDNYSNQQLTITAAGNYRQPLSVGYLNIAADLGYLHKMAFNEAVTDNNRFADLATYLRAAQLQANLAIRYAFPIKGRFSWFVEPVATYNHYLAARTCYAWDVMVKTGVVF